MQCRKEDISLRCAFKKIKEMVACSPLPEDLPHAENTLKWLLYLKPDAGLPLQIAALGHDIERGAGKRRVRKEDSCSYDQFKRAHAENSAKILKEILVECGVDLQIVEEACELVANHEFGGWEEADLLRDADKISFFDVNITYYYLRNGREKTKERCLWGLRLLSKEGRRIVESFSFKNPCVEEIVKECLEMCTLTQSDAPYPDIC
ncbi:MAG TPA: DUF4202 family protein [Thermoplasmata archaeon]|nr:DUF4202 family protein [Thermoplasmata archaeon]